MSSYSKKRNQRRATMIGALIGVMVIAGFLITLIAPDLGQRSTAGNPPAATPFGTLPPATQIVVPTPDPNPQLAGALPYIHSSGLFQTFRPAGSDWLVSESDLQGADSIASVVFRSAARLALFHNYIQPGVEYESLEALSAGFLTAEHYQTAWNAYDGWQETGRQITPDGVVTDFALQASGSDYLGRSVTRLDRSWLYVTRIVVPANNAPLLDMLDRYLRAYFVGYPAMQALPVAWPAFVDQQLGYALKHPADWSLLAGGNGRPATLSAATASGQHTVRLHSVLDGTVTNEQAARDWLAQEVPGATLLGLEPLTITLEGGYLLAYTFTDAQGNPQSGLAVLLNNDEGRLLVANARIDSPDANLLSADTTPPDLADLRRALTEGFLALPPAARYPIGEMGAAE